MFGVRSIAIAPFAAAVVLLGGCSDDSGPTTIEIPITQITVTRKCSPLVVGARCTLGVAAFSGEQQVADPILTFFSSSSAVSVDNDGTVTAIAIGSATITITDAPATVSTQTNVVVIGEDTK